jgi:phosphohistidine swiveling domain-containing protein
MGETDMAGQAQTISFKSASGAFYTDHLRSLVLSRRWRQAFADGMEMFVGIDEASVWSILKGEMRLQEDAGGDMDLVVDEDAAEYLDQLEYMYGGVCDIDGGLYRPARIVTDYGPEDHRLNLRSNLNFIPESFHDDFMAIRDEVMIRAKRYKQNDTETLVVCRAPSKREPDRVRPFVVIFAPAPDLPLWILPKRSPQEAVNTSLDHLSYTGHAREFPTFDPNRKRPVDFAAELEKMRASKRMITAAEIDFTRLEMEQQAEAAERHRSMVEERTALILQRNADMGYRMRSVDFGPEFGTREVPEGPLLKWAVDTLRIEEQTGRIEWTSVSPVGVKMNFDNPAHTDWRTAAGLLDEDVLAIEWELAGEIQRELLGFEVHVLSQGQDSATGTVKICLHPDDEIDENTIAVIPNAGVRFFELALKAAAVITAEGGAMSHLAINGLDHGLLVVRDPNAMETYEDGMIITIDGARGTIRVQAGFQPDNEPPNTPRP